jgi:phosphatidate cytidylyltransferase
MTRLITALLLVPTVLYVTLIGPSWLVLAVTALVAAICYSEFCKIASTYGMRGSSPVGYAAGLLVLAAPLEWGFPALILVVLAALSLALTSDDLAKALPSAAVWLLGIAYIFGTWKFAILLHAANRHWLTYALVLNWVGDAAAYYVGRRWGRHKMSPRVSPNKSWEGAAAAMVASVVFGVLYLQRAIPTVSLLEAVVLTAIANAAGQVGDFAESALKRGANVKDSSSLLPGHGGLLDRVDSTLFAMPVVYLKLYLAATFLSAFLP